MHLPCDLQGTLRFQHRLARIHVRQEKLAGGISMLKGSQKNGICASLLEKTARQLAITPQKLKTVYEIESVLPQSIYTVTTYDDNRECFYRFINDRNLIFQSKDKDDIIVVQYPAENGFCQQQSKKVNEKDALLYYELYWDYKNPENSYFLQNTEGDAIRYGYDKKNKFWYEKEIIPYETKGETQTFNGGN